MKNFQRRVPRRGSAIIPVFACFVLVLLMTSALLKTGQAQRAQVRGEERRLQAEWLAEAGLERAAAMLAKSRDYTGEIWEVKAEELDAAAAGSVVIKVETVKDHPERRRVNVQADFPRDADQRARQRKTAIVEVDPEKAKEKS